MSTPNRLRLVRSVSPARAKDVERMTRILRENGFDAAPVDIEGAYSSWSAEKTNRPWHNPSYLNDLQLLAAIKERLRPADEPESEGPSTSTAELGLILAGARTPAHTSSDVNDAPATTRQDDPSRGQREAGDRERANERRSESTPGAFAQELRPATQANAGNKPGGKPEPGKAIQTERRAPGLSEVRR